MLNDCLVNLLGNLFNGSRIYSFFLLILFFYTTFIKRSIHKSICSNALLKTQ